MSFFLIEPGLDLSIELEVPTSLEQALAIQVDRLADQSTRNSFCERLRLALQSALPEALDWDIKPPTEAQRAYARSLAHKFGVPIPQDAMNLRGDMHKFIEHYAQLAKGERDARSNGFGDDSPF